MIKNKNILLADIGATNARLAINQEKGRYKYSEERRVNDFKSIEELFSSYLDNINMTGLIRKAVIGVAAPIVSDRVSFVNCPISFSQKNLKNKFFSEGLIVLNDLELQAHAISNLFLYNIISAKGPFVANFVGMEGLIYAFSYLIILLLTVLIANKISSRKIKNWYRN